MEDKNIDKELKKVWKEEATQQPNDKKEASWNDFSAKVFEKKPRKIKPWYYAAAAILVVFLSLSGILLSDNSLGDKSDMAYTIVENPTRKVKLINLPDSSVVELQPNAKLEYTSDFKGNRKINLKGTAFFKVHKDKEHPFRVFCGETTTTVLGTCFTVTEGEENSVSVKLYEGSVQMTVKDSLHNWLLSPGEEFVYNKKAVTVEAFNRFKDFDNVPLKSVLKYIKENYGYEVIMPKSYTNMQVTLRLNEKENLTDVIHILAEMYNLNPQINEEIKKVTFKQR